MTSTITELAADYDEHKVTRIGGIIGVSLFLAMTLASVVVLANDLSSHKPDPALPPLAWSLLSISFATFAVLCSYSVGPNYLHFEFANGSYSVKRGFPCKAKAFTGPIDDISELYLKEFRGKGGSFWHLMAGWKRMQDRRFCLLVCDDLPASAEDDLPPMIALGEGLSVPTDAKPR